MCSSDLSEAASEFSSALSGVSGCPFSQGDRERGLGARAASHPAASPKEQARIGGHLGRRCESPDIVATYCRDDLDFESCEPQLNPLVGLTGPLVVRRLTRSRL